MWPFKRKSDTEFKVTKTVTPIFSACYTFPRAKTPKLFVLLDTLGQCTNEAKHMAQYNVWTYVQSILPKVDITKTPHHIYVVNPFVVLIREGTPNQWELGLRVAK